MRIWLTSLIALCACMSPVASADIYTWTDAQGRVNVSNVAPPEGVRVTRVQRETPKPDAAALRDNTREVEMRALADRVRQLEQEVDAAKSAPPPPMMAASVASAPPQITIPVFNYVVAGASPPSDATYDSQQLGYGGWMPYAYPPAVAIVDTPSMRRPYPYHPTARRPVYPQPVRQQLPYVAMGRLPLTFAR